MSETAADKSQPIEVVARKLGLVSVILAVAVVLIGALGWFVTAEAGALVRTEVDKGIEKHAERPHVGVATKDDIAALRGEISKTDKVHTQKLDEILTAVKETPQ